MPEPGQELQPQNQTPKKVRVFGPDNRYYQFPEGTTKEKAVAFFKQKGITSAESKPPKMEISKPTTLAEKAAVAMAPTPQKVSEESKFLKDDTAYQGLKEYSQGKYRPRWDNPKAILNDPTWYGRSARYFGGELLGASRAVAGLSSGGWKILNDIASAVNPIEVKEQLDKKQTSPLYEDVVGAGHSIRDVGKDVWDLIRHFPEAGSDPEHFGNTISNAAMIVDGGVKSAKSISELMKTDPLETTRVANNAANGVPSKYFKRKAFEDSYVHSKGLDVAKKVHKAAASIHEEVKTHASSIASQIDKALPSGVIDAAEEAKLIKDEFKDVVKAPERMHPALANALADANKTAPGQWTWEKTRQFRTSVGQAMGKTGGPQKVVLTKVYKDLTGKLADTAKQHGLEDSWNHYNELERKTSHQFADHIDSIRNSQSGKEVASHLNRDPALTHELTKNLSKYGLDVKDIQKFMRDSNRIAKQQKGWTGTLFRMAYGTPAGVPVMLAAKAAGAGWMGSVGAGALVGYASTALINAVRAAKLSPEVIEHIMSERELPGRLPVSRGKFETPEAPDITPTLPSTPTPPQLPGMTPVSEPKAPAQLPSSSGYKASEKASTLTEKARDYGPEYDAANKEHMIQRYKDILKNPKATSDDVKEAEARLKELGAIDTKVEKVPEGQHGKGKLAVQAKARERVSKAREWAKRTRDAEVQEAHARAHATDMDVSQLQIPEMEEALKSMNPKGLSGLQKLRRASKIPDSEYQEALKYYLLEAYEKRGAVSHKTED